MRGSLFISTLRSSSLAHGSCTDKTPLDRGYRALLSLFYPTAFPKSLPEGRRNCYEEGSFGILLAKETP